MNLFLQGKFATLKTEVLLCHMESWWDTVYDVNHWGWMLFDWQKISFPKDLYAVSLQILKWGIYVYSLHFCCQLNFIYVEIRKISDSLNYIFDSLMNNSLMFFFLITKPSRVHPRGITTTHYLMGRWLLTQIHIHISKKEDTSFMIW
jgi:hypothetical protein